MQTTFAKFIVISVKDIYVSTKRITYFCHVTNVQKKGVIFMLLYHTVTIKYINCTLCIIVFDKLLTVPIIVSSLHFI